MNAWLPQNARSEFVAWFGDVKISEAFLLWSTVICADAGTASTPSTSSAAIRLGNSNFIDTPPVWPIPTVSRRRVVACATSPLWVSMGSLAGTLPQVGPDHAYAFAP